MLIYILTVRELPLPDFLLRKIEARLAEADFTIKFGHARLDPTGKILLQDVQLRSKQFDEPLLTSRVVYVRRNFWSILAGRPIPDEIRLEGAIIQLPALLSPSGTAEPLIRDLAAVLRHDANVWHIDQLNGRLGRLKVMVQGDIITQHTAGPKVVSPQEITAKFLQMGRRFILNVNQLEAFENPTLNIHLETESGGVANTAACLFTADSVRHPWEQPVESGSMTVATKFRFDGRREQTLLLNATAREINHSQQFRLKTINAVISARFNTEPLSINLSAARIAIGSLEIDGERVAGPMIRADLRKWPEIKLSTAFQIEGEPITAEISADIKERAAHLAIEGTGSPSIINRMLYKHTPRAAPYFIFADPVFIVAEAVLSSGWHFERLSSRVVAGRLNSHDVRITSARGRIDIEGMDFIAHDAQVEMEDNVARGSYWMNFATTDYRMLLKGRLFPPKITGWFTGDWWNDFWNEHFKFPKTLPEGDVDVQGRWRDSSRTEYFGRAKVDSAGIWGGKFDKVQAVVFLRPLFTHVIEFNGVRSGGAQKLEGSLKRFADDDTRETRRIEFDLDGNIDQETYHGMLEGKADEVLSTLQFSVPPHVRAHGTMDKYGTEMIPNYTFTGRAASGLRYYGVPVDTIQVTGGIKGNDVRLDDIQFTALNGKGAGKASLTGQAKARRLGFDLYLNSADLPQTIRAVQEFQAKRHGQNTNPATTVNFIKRASGGRLDIALSGQGVPDNLSTFVGTGNAALTGANLGEIQLFGLLSQALSGLSLNFSSLKLDSAHTSFRMENGRLHFPDLKITGPSAAIEARGDFIFETTALDFTAKFKPFEESKNLLTAAIGIVINPITSILELRLTGPLNQPNWSIDVGSLAPRQDAPNSEKKDTESLKPERK
jgi:AsmA-like C-terminal region